MTKRIIELNLTCTDSLACLLAIKDGLENAGINWGTPAARRAHMSVEHVQGNHKIWVFTYSNNGEHEQEVDGQNIKVLDPKVKASTVHPTKATLESNIRTKLQQTAGVVIL